MNWTLESLFDNVIFEIGKYTAIPALIVAVAPTPPYGSRVLFTLLLVLNWIVLTEFRMRDIRAKLGSVTKKKTRRKRK